MKARVGGRAFHHQPIETAVSIPDDVFEQAEQLARRTKKSRSQLVSDALREYVSRHAPEEVTETIDRVVADIGREPATEEFVAAAARRVLDATEW